MLLISIRCKGLKATKNLTTKISSIETGKMQVILSRILTLSVVLLSNSKSTEHYMGAAVHQCHLTSVIPFSCLNIYLYSVGYLEQDILIHLIILYYHILNIR
jgi:hypothetical protein